MSRNYLDNSLIKRRIQYIYLIYIFIFVYNIIISIFFNINTLDIIQYFSWSGKNLGGDLLSCCKYAYSDILVEGHPYPPFSYLFFKLCNFLFNISSRDNFSMNFQVYYLVYIFLSLMLSIFMIQLAYIKESISKKFFIILLLIVCCNNWSLGNIMLGNLSILTLPLCLYFCLNIDSNDKKITMLSIFCIVLAFGLKLTPVVYLFLLLYKKRYKEFIISLCLTSFVFIVPFANFNTVSLIDNIKIFLINAFNYSKYYIDRVGGLMSIVTFLNKTKWFNLNSDTIVLIAKIMSKVLLIIMLLCAKLADTKKQILILTLCITLIGPAYPHYIVYFTIPFIMYLFSNKCYNNFEKVYFILMLIILIPYKSFYLASIFGKDESILRSVITDFCINVICLIIIIETVFIYHSKRKIIY